MKLKKIICRDILQILKEKEIPSDQINKILTKLANYTYESVVKKGEQTEPNELGI